MEVSVAIAAFNGERFLEDQLRSIDTQTVSAREIVVSDDLSTDETPKIVSNFQANSKVMTLWLRSKKLGAFENFSAAINACKGPLIAYCDQDDVWEPNKLETVLPYFQDKDVTLVAHSSRICDEALRPSQEVVPSELTQGNYKLLFVPSRFWCWGHQMVFHKDVWLLAKDLLALPETAGTGITSTHDFLIPFSAGLLGTCVHLDSALTLFRRHRGSLTLAGKLSEDERSSLAKKFLHQAYGARLEHTQLARWMTLLETPEVSGVVLGHLEKRSPSLKANVRLDEYIAHQKKRLKWVNARHLLYSAQSYRTRAQAFFGMIRFGAYGSPLKGKLPLKLIALDGLGVLIGPSYHRE